MKTKEMIIDFHEKKPILEAIKINNTAADIVKTYQYLGNITDDKLIVEENNKKVYKKDNQHMYFVRKLKKCYIDKSIMSVFYKSVVESGLNF